MSEPPPKARCGNCGKPYQEHFFEDQIYCNDRTNGDWWSDEPDDISIADMLREDEPSMYENMVMLWRKQNGYGDHKPRQD